MNDLSQIFHTLGRCASCVSALHQAGNQGHPTRASSPKDAACCFARGPKAGDRFAVRINFPYCNPREKGFGVSVNFTNHACMDLGVVVDRKTGKRFMDEHAGRKIKSDALFKVIGADENYPIAVCDDAIVKAINPSFVKLPLEMGTVKKFNTLEELADHFGIKKAPFLAEVKKFNGFVKSGEDTDFHRILKFNNGLDVSKAPFYGIEVSPKIHHTMGGVMINEKAEVISAATQKPIKGLFAGGEITGGVHGASRLGTVAVTDALTFGMIAGENFAAMK